jgi:DNA invertase Pin-like site-specific DNA recombinase
MYDLLLSVFAWVAQYESQWRSERTKAGMARAVKLGKRPGRRAGVDTVDLDLVARMKDEGRSWAGRSTRRTRGP